MKTLETTFVSAAGGFANEPLTYTQITRTQKFAVYQRERDGVIKDYEVFEIKIDPKGKVQKFPNGSIKVVEDDTEKYASTNQFGRIAWSFKNRGGALHRFNELCNPQLAAAILVNEEDTDPVEQTAPVATGRRGRAKGERPLLVVGEGEFSCKELAAANNVEYPVAVVFIREAIEAGTLKFVRSERRQAKGKETNLYSKV